MDFLNKKNWCWDSEDLLEINSESLDDLICKVCYCLKYEIKICTECSYVLSYDCFELLKNDNKPCPTCDGSLENYKEPSKIWKKIYNKIKVYCILKDFGCDKIWLFGNLETHLKYDCKFKNKFFIIIANKIPIEKFNLFNDQKTEIYYNFDKLIVNNPVLDDQFKKEELIFKINENLDKNEPILKKIDMPIGIIIEKKIYSEDKYYGEIKQYRKNGFGIYYFNNGYYYEGFWKDDKFNGKGLFKNDKGDFHLGEWTLGRKNGFGEEKINENYYKGNFKDNLKNGLGFYKWKNNNTYEGYYKNGKRDGKGICNFNDGSFYNGQWKNGEENGYGIEKCIKDNSIYEGYFNNGTKEGFGKCEYDNKKKVYYGNWKLNKYNGFGILFYEDNKYFYEGFWKNNLREGKGIDLSEEGIYFGDFKRNKKNGTGILIYRINEIFEGNWINDERKDGILIDKEGKINNIN